MTDGAHFLIEVSAERLAEDWSPRCASLIAGSGGAPSVSSIEEGASVLAGMPDLLIAAWMWHMGHIEMRWRAPVWGYVWRDTMEVALADSWSSHRYLEPMVDLVLDELRLGWAAAAMLTDADRKRRIGIGRAWERQGLRPGWKDRHAAVLHVGQSLVGEARYWISSHRV